MPEQIKEILQLYHDGLRQEAVAGRLGISKSAISKRLKIAGLTEASILRSFRKGMTPESILAALAGDEQPSLDLPEADESGGAMAECEALRAEVVRLRAVIEYAAVHFYDKGAEYLRTQLQRSHPHE